LNIKSPPGKKNPKIRAHKNKTLKKKTVPHFNFGCKNYSKISEPAGVMSFVFTKSHLERG
jgi:hypothetical protein